jgi:hypothetical protein
LAKRIQKSNGNSRVDISPGEAEYYYSRGQQRLSKEDLDKINQERKEIIEEIFLLAKLLGKDINSLVELKKDYYTNKIVLEDGKPIVISPNSDLKATLNYLHSVYYDYILSMPEEISSLQSYEYLTNDNLNIKIYEKILIKWGYSKDIFKEKSLYVAKKIYIHATNKRWKIAKELENIEKTYNTFDDETITADYFFYSEDTTAELEALLGEIKDALTVKHRFS